MLHLTATTVTATWSIWSTTGVTVIILGALALAAGIYSSFITIERLASATTVLILGALLIIGGSVTIAADQHRLDTVAEQVADEQMRTAIEKLKTERAASDAETGDLR